jgi:hypothetical protein
MKRRAFIITTSTVAVGLPLAYYVNRYYHQKNSLFKPDTLSLFCDDIVLNEMGKNYLAVVPAENEKEKLTHLILTDKNGNITNKSAIEQLLAKKIKEDFLNNNTIILQNWVVSITEARQCALFSLITNKI